VTFVGVASVAGSVAIAPGYQPPRLAALAPTPVVTEATPSISPSPSGSPTPSSAPPSVASRLSAPVPTSVALSALSPWTAQLHIAAPPGTQRVQIYRQGRLLDDFAASPGAFDYTDHLLWPSTGYLYDLRWLGAGGQLIADRQVTTTTPAQRGPVPRLYASTSFWNRPIPASPAIDAGSAAMVAKAIVPYATSANLANSNDWGRSLAYADGRSRLYTVGCSLYSCDTAVSFRIPAYAQPNTGSDHHLAVIDAVAGGELDMWLGAGSAGGWSAGSRYLTSTLGWGAICAQGQHCGGANAAGFALMGGIIRPEEIAQGHIDHALFFTTPYTRSGLIACPATSSDGQFNDPGALPEGAHIQLDPAVNVDAQAWPRWEKVVAHALQTYGAYLGDTGGSLAFFGENSLDRGYDAWSRAGAPVSASLAGLPWAAFRVLQLRNC